MLGRHPSQLVGRYVSLDLEQGPLSKGINPAGLDRRREGASTQCPKYVLLYEPVTICMSRLAPKVGLMDRKSPRGTLRARPPASSGMLHDDATALFVVERRLPGITARGLAMLQAALLESSGRFAARGEHIAYLRSTFLPDQDRLLSLFSARSWSWSGPRTKRPLSPSSAFSAPSTFRIRANAGGVVCPRCGLDRARLAREKSADRGDQLCGTPAGAARSQEAPGNDPTVDAHRQRGRGQDPARAQGRRRVGARVSGRRLVRTAGVDPGSVAREPGGLRGSWRTGPISRLVAGHADRSLGRQAPPARAGQLRTPAGRLCSAREHPLSGPARTCDSWPPVGRHLAWTARSGSRSRPWQYRAMGTRSRSSGLRER